MWCHAFFKDVNRQERMQSSAKWHSMSLVEPCVKILPVVRSTQANMEV